MTERNFNYFGSFLSELSKHAEDEEAKRALGRNILGVDFLETAINEAILSEDELAADFIRALNSPQIENIALRSKIQNNRVVAIKELVKRALVAEVIGHKIEEGDREWLESVLGELIESSKEPYLEA